MIIIITGPSGVGKTTVSRELATFFDKCVHIRADDIHNLIVNSEVIPEQIALTDENIKDLVKNFTKHGYTEIILDNVYETPEHLQQVIQGLSQYVDEIVPFRLQCDLQENLYRNSIRDEYSYMEEERVVELHNILTQQGDSLGIVIDSTGLTVQETAKKIMDYLKER